MAAKEPTIRKRIVGKYLRRFREAAGVPIEDVVESFNISRPAAYRQESGQSSTSMADAEKYLAMYKVDDPATTQRFLDLTRTSQKKGWWEGYRNAADLAQVEIADLEDLAGSISNYEPMLIPGLIQTERYSEALIMDSSVPLRRHDVNAMKSLELRNERKAILHRENRPKFAFAFSEIALHYPAAGPDVMREQIHHLIHLINNHDVDIRMIPQTPGAPSRIPTRQIFMISTGGEEGEAIAYFDNPLGGSLIDDPDATRRMADLFTYAQAQAMPPADTARYLEGSINR